MKVIGKPREGTLLENPSEKFNRLATKRTNEVLNKLRILGNCANRQVYEYSREDVNKIFSAIEKKVKEIKAKFKDQKEEEFKL